MQYFHLLLFSNVLLLLLLLLLPFISIIYSFIHFILSLPPSW